MAGGKLLHGLLHPEFGHMRIPHDRERDPFPGVCPYHGDCWEGLASGRAIEARWGRPPEELDRRRGLGARRPDYLALGLVGVICVLSPERVVIGGGVMKRPGAAGRSSTARSCAPHERLPGGAAAQRRHLGLRHAPGLGARAGVLGAIALAESA